MSPLDHPDCSLTQTNPSAQYAPNSLIRIPVVVHVIQDSGGQGALTNAQVNSQIDILNEDFRARTATPGQGGTDAMIEFFLTKTDPNGNPTNGITRSTNNTWFADGGAYWNSLAWDTSRFLNIYTNSAGGGGILGYVPDLPQGGSVLGTNADRVVVHWQHFGRCSSGTRAYTQGRTCTHEVAHYLGLLHTFEGGCAPAGGCYSNGDLICDTPPEAGPNFGCTAATSCGVQAPIHNYMDYTDDLCMWQFTPEQIRRMRCTIVRYRSTLPVGSRPMVSAFGKGCRFGTSTCLTVNTQLSTNTIQPPTNAWIWLRVDVPTGGTLNVSGFELLLRSLNGAPVRVQTALRDVDANGRPGTLRGNGTEVLVTTAQSWCTTWFASQLLAPGARYWIGYYNPASGVSLGGTANASGQAVTWRHEAGAGLSGAQQYAWKYRLLCGGATPNPGFASGRPLLGQRFVWRVDDVPPGQWAFPFYGLSRTIGLVFGSVQLLPLDMGAVGATQCDILVSPEVLAFGAAGPLPGGNAWQAWIDAPPNPAYVGLNYYGQWAVGSPGANAQGVTLSNAIHLVFNF